MLLFILCTSSLVAIALWFIGPILFSQKKLNQVDLEQENLEIARQRMAEVSSQLSADTDSPRDSELLGQSKMDSDIQLELEATLLDDIKGPDYNLSGVGSASVRSGIAVLLGIPIATILLYGLLGNPQWNNPPVATAQTQHQSQSGTATQNTNAGSLDTLIVGLEQSLRDNPDNIDGWALAGRTYMSLSQFDKAENAYARLNQLSGDDPTVLAAWADASLMVNGNIYTADISSRILRALELDPLQGNALWIAGIGSMSIGKNRAALNYLNQLLPLLENDSEASRQVNNIIAQIKSSQSALGESETGQPEPLPSESTGVVAAENSRVIQVSVELDPALQNQLKGNELVFVFARAPNGPPFPLAVARLTVNDLPTQLKLDDSMSMMPGQNISSVDEVAITARVSRSGNPIAQSGDFTSQATVSVTEGSPSVALTINQEVE